MTDAEADAATRADVYRKLEAYFSRLTTMQCPATLEERMRSEAERYEREATHGR